MRGSLLISSIIFLGSFFSFFAVVANPKDGKPSNELVHLIGEDAQAQQALFKALTSVGAKIGTEHDAAAVTLKKIDFDLAFDSEIHVNIILSLDKPGNCFFGNKRGLVFKRMLNAREKQLFNAHEFAHFFANNIMLELNVRNREKKLLAECFHKKGVRFANCGSRF